MELSKRFYAEVVEPVIKASFPALKYTAGLIDYGSDVLGYDTEVSQDHQWGPRLSIFLSEHDLSLVGGLLDQGLSEKLPKTFLGFPTNFSGTKDTYIRIMEDTNQDRVQHLIRIHTLEEFFSQHLGMDIHKEIEVNDWLLFPQQRLLTIAKGQFFHDDLHADRLKHALAYFPDPVWRYAMACEWNKIHDEEAFVGRCGAVGDDLGSRLVASRQIHRIMRLCFYQERTYMPYSKWFGTAFNELESAETLGPLSREILDAQDWKTRESRLAEAYQYIAERHNRLEITEYLEPKIQNYFDREYQVIFADRFAQALFSSLGDESLMGINKLGTIDQMTESLGILENSSLMRVYRTLYSQKN